MPTDSSALNDGVLRELRGNLRGTVTVATDADYAAARCVWNGAIDRYPAAVITCSDAEDVAAALRIATARGLAVTVRGGGHNVAGRCIRDGALLLDLSRLNGVAVNTESRIATVQGGALWRDVDAATARAGLATTGGLVSSTGVGGFTLGGGAGWLMRKHGLACDNVIAASVILSDGRVVRASAAEHADLYWALRGGAGGLGVVTSFDFRTYPLRNVFAGLIIHSGEHALEALQVFRDFATDAPDEFCGLAVVANAPPLPFLDSQWHGRPVVIHAVCWAGDQSTAERVLAPLRGFGRPLAEHLGWMPYVHWQQLQDPSAPAGLRYYWKTANYRSVGDSTLQVLAAAAQQLPTPRSEIHLQHMGGAVGRVAPGDTAFAQRAANFFVNLIGITDHAEAMPGMRERVRELYARITPEAMATIQPNFSDQDDAQAERQFGGEIAGRLATLRRRYDARGLLADT
ncbi:MAG TPA: FAD-binding oxidoreductase [Steroidobacteraceae bacterium]|jgi:FAD/FMN-containing dehydrogenase|nr:FAD-binding oxidoreductase [Steroidobacteraceae bacterium]